MGYLECGDRDFMCLHDGAEHLHNLMWKLRIPHEYRLTLGGDHVGASFEHRLPQAMDWVSRSMQVNGINKQTPSMTEPQRQYAEWFMDKHLKKTEGTPDEPPKGSEEVSHASDGFLAFFREQHPTCAMKNYIDKPYDGWGRETPEIVKALQKDY